MEDYEITAYYDALKEKYKAEAIIKQFSRDITSVAIKDLEERYGQIKLREEGIVYNFLKVKVRVWEEEATIHFIHIIDAKLTSKKRKILEEAIESFKNGDLANYRNFKTPLWIVSTYRVSMKTLIKKSYNLDLES